MTECTFKLRPIPKFTALCVVTFSDPDAMRSFLVKLLNSYMEPVTLEVVNLRDVLITFEDVEEAVHAQIEWVNTHVPNSATVDTRTGTDVHSYWRSFNDLSFTHNDPIILKVGTKNMHVLDVLQNCKRLTDVNVYAHGGVAHGLSRIYLSGDTADVTRAIQNVRTHAEHIGGHATIVDAPLDVRKMVAPWGEPPAYMRLLEGIKHQLDPDTILSPTRVVGGM
ncbi:FAD-binding oxidoreductase [Geomicrobium sp. JCM 19039]|uniref:FAD-binding oxidoreductase n=1 Tax=Geomicrobium sp. JCM 19039 TaxID=1460636 RepID=UPI0009DF4486|nr:FAD-binding oxidoreductase [Geomicrobium sp. JCM 19039]